MAKHERCTGDGSTSLERHFTVTGFVSHRGRTALHWHRLGLWLPPGGHIEPNEDPIQAVLREVREETGLEVVVLGQPPFAYASPPQLPPPVTIGVYDLEHGDPGTPRRHQHIDLIYFTRPRAEGDVALPASDGWAWVDELALREATALAPPEGAPAAVPEDVRRLGLAAIEAARVYDERAHAREAVR